MTGQRQQTSPLPRENAAEEGWFNGLRYAVIGDGGPWVVFSHAIGVDCRSLAAQARHCVDLGFRVLLWDLPGHGRSTKQTCPSAMADLADVLTELVQHVTDDPSRVVLVGHSFGGYLSQLVAMRHQHLVRGVVAIGCTSLTIYPSRRDLTALYLFAGLLRITPRRTRRRLGEFIRGPNQLAHRYIRDATAQVTPRAAASACLALVRALRDEPDARLDCPLLVVRGERDHVGIIATAAPLWAARHNARYEVIPAAGHHAPFENPLAVNAVLTRFLRELLPNHRGRHGAGRTTTA